MQRVIEAIGPPKVVAFVSDNAPNMRAAWAILRILYPWIVFTGCKAHILHLVCSDVCKIKLVHDTIQWCKDIAKFF